MSIRFDIGPIQENTSRDENILIGDRIAYSGQFPITLNNFRHPILQAFFIHNNAQVSEYGDEKIKIVADKLNFLCDLNGYLLHNGVDIENQSSLDAVNSFEYNHNDTIVAAKKELIAALKKSLPQIKTLIPTPALEPLEVPEEKADIADSALLNDDELEAQAGIMGIYASLLHVTKKLYKKIINPLQAFLLGSISPDYKYDDWVQPVIPVVPVVVPKPVVAAKSVVEQVQTPTPPWGFSVTFGNKAPVPEVAPKPVEAAATPNKGTTMPLRLQFA